MNDERKDEVFASGGSRKLQRERCSPLQFPWEPPRDSTQTFFSVASSWEFYFHSALHSPLSRPFTQLRLGPFLLWSSHLLSCVLSRLLFIFFASDLLFVGGARFLNNKWESVNPGNYIYLLILSSQIIFPLYYMKFYYYIILYIYRYTMKEILWL